METAERLGVYAVEVPRKNSINDKREGGLVARRQGMEGYENAICWCEVCRSAG